MVDELNNRKISVLVATYNPKVDDLLRSLKSIILQKEICVEIVITDDGSKEFPEDEVNNFFDKHSFVRFKIVRNAENRGTVYNFLSGAPKCTSEYIKVLGQGDILFDEYTLRDLLNFDQLHNVDLLGSEAVCFKEIDGIASIEECDAMPQLSYCYNSPFLQRRTSILFEDDAQGSTLLYRKAIFVEYLNEVAGKLKFIEDKTQKLMILDGKVVRYYNRAAVYYECSQGISNNSKRQTEINQDRIELNNLILKRLDDNTRFRKAFIKNQTHKHNLSIKYSRIESIRWAFCNFGFVFYRIRKERFPRKTITAITPSFLHKCMDN